MTCLHPILGALGVLLALSFIAATLGRFVRGLVYPLCGAAALLLLGVNATFLLTQPAIESLVTPFGLPQIGAHLRLDSLSAFFGIVVNLGGFLASLYAIGYGRHEQFPLRVLPFYPAFLAAMNLVLIADDAFTFLVAWEFMSLVSWALVVSHHRAAVNCQAGYIYLLMACFGALALLFAFGILAGDHGAYAFEAMRANHPAAWMAGLVLVLALIGAGSKAGIVPLHVWLPLAHPAAPSHVSALMSGVMTKVAVYGFVRIAFDLLGPPESWWSMVVLAFGGVTCVMGVLYALMQHDLKRLLAYHTVENIGIIFIGLGLALAFSAHNMPAIAALAMAAGLFHVFNHSLFKSLLFFGAGSVLTATGERDMEHLGGLIHRMPQTAFVFLVGCVAISALPPLNGFVSEWMTFQAVLLSPQLPSWGLKLIVPLVGVLLAMSAALAAACFVKAFGVTFLGRARTKAAAEAKETDRWSLTTMFCLAAICFAAGVLPGLFLDALAPVTQSLVGAHIPVQKGVDWLSILPTGSSRSSYNGLIIFLFMALAGSFMAWTIHAFASRRVRKTAAWDCGFPDQPINSQYTASSFAQPIRRVFGTTVFHAQENVDMPDPGETRAAAFRVRLVDPVWSWFYEPIARNLQYAANKLSVMQFLSIRRYLMLTFFALITLLIVVALWH